MCPLPCRTAQTWQKKDLPKKTFERSAFFFCSDLITSPVLTKPIAKRKKSAIMRPINRMQMA